VPRRGLEAGNPRIYMILRGLFMVLVDISGFFNICCVLSVVAYPCDAIILILHVRCCQESGNTTKSQAQLVDQLGGTGIVPLFWVFNWSHLVSGPKK